MWFRPRRINGSPANGLFQFRDNMEIQPNKNTKTEHTVDIASLGAGRPAPSALPGTFQLERGSCGDGRDAKRNQCHPDECVALNLSGFPF